MIAQKMLVNQLENMNVKGDSVRAAKSNNGLKMMQMVSDYYRCRALLDLTCIHMYIDCGSTLRYVWQNHFT